MAGISANGIGKEAMINAGPVIKTGTDTATISARPDQHWHDRRAGRHIVPFGNDQQHRHHRRRGWRHAHRQFLSGTGTLDIHGGTTMVELLGASSDSFVFSDNAGAMLKPDQAAAFTGHIRGFVPRPFSILTMSSADRRP